MTWLAMTPERLVATSELAEHTKVPPHYLAKVLQQLAAADLVTGRRGVGGGYKIAREAGDITMLEVIRAVSPVERIRACPLGIESHGTVLCPLHKRADAVAKAVIEIYDQHTLKDIIEDDSPTPLCHARPQELGLPRQNGNGTANGHSPDA